MFLLVPAHPGYPRQNPESHEIVVWVCVAETNLRCDSMFTDDSLTVTNLLQSYGKRMLKIDQKW